MEYNMNDFKDRIEKVFDELKTERDDLRVRLHLVKLESSEEWLKIEHKLVKLESKARELGSATAEASGEMSGFSDIDTNDDGVISEEEFAAHQAEHRAQMQQQKK
jgi:hypothetical protein